MDLEGRSDESGTDNWRFDLARRAPSRRRAFSYTERRVNGEPPHARRAVEGTGDRPPGGHPRLCRKGCAHLPGHDRQDVVPGAARVARGASEALGRLARRLAPAAGPRAALRGGSLLSGGSLGSGLAAFRLLHAPLERLHQVDDRRLGNGLRFRDLLAVELRLEHLAQVTAVLAMQLQRI